MIECYHCHRALGESEFEITRRGRRKKSCRSCCIRLSRASRTGISSKSEGPPVAYGSTDAYREATSGTSYESRSVVLRELGFSSYREYLGSELWRSIRRRVYARWGDKCHLCCGRAEHLHHNRYGLSEMSGKAIGMIRPVCARCHESIEFGLERGEKLTVAEARRKFRLARRSMNRAIARNLGGGGR